MAKAIADAQAGLAGGSAKDRPLVPLWMTRPESAKRTAGSSAAADHAIAGMNSGAGSANAAEHYTPPSLDAPPSPVTSSVAETHWADMTEEEQMQFADQAEKAGMWK